MSKSLRIVFMGTPGFAVESLRQIHASNQEVVAVVTAPDRPAGRGRKLKASEVKEYALEQGIPVLQPEKLRNPEFLADLKSFEADLFVVVAFRMLPELVWSMPNKGTINLHASLLPQYRGAAPINWAIINGEQKTGATTFFINAEIDKGETIDSIEVDIDSEDNAEDLHDRLMVLGGGLLVRTIQLISEDNASAKPQENAPHLHLKKAPKLNPENRKIDWSSNAKEIHNLIRGLSPYPTAISTLMDGHEGVGCKFYRSHITEFSQLAPGEISSDNRVFLRVGTGDFDLEIQELQLSGKKRLGIKDLLNGYKFPENAKFK